MLKRFQIRADLLDIRFLFGLNHQHLDGFIFNGFCFIRIKINLFKPDAVAKIKAGFYRIRLNNLHHIRYRKRPRFIIVRFVDIELFVHIFKRRAVNLRLVYFVIDFRANIFTVPIPFQTVKSHKGNTLIVPVGIDLVYCYFHFTLFLCFIISRISPRHTPAEHTARFHCHPLCFCNTD